MSMPDSNRSSQYVATPQHTAQPAGPLLPNPDQFIAQTRDVATQLYKDVSEAYLQFRRDTYHEENPSLATEPAPLKSVQQSESARLAEGTLRVVPGAAKAVPLVHELVDHLQRVVNIHTLTENERMTLHNVAMVFLYGVRDGIQPWYVEYMLTSAQALAPITNPDYYVDFPWHALFYKTPQELTAFSQAVRAGDSAGIVPVVQQLARDLIDALQHPYEAQENLAFSGPDGARQKTIFDLKTSAGLAVGAYLAVEAVRTFMGAPQEKPHPQAAIKLIPDEMSQHLVPRDTAEPS